MIETSRLVVAYSLPINNAGILYDKAARFIELSDLAAVKRIKRLE